VNKKKLSVLAFTFVVVFIVLQVIARVYGFSTVNSLYSAISLIILIIIADLIILTIVKGIHKKFLGGTILLCFFMVVWSVSSIVYLFIMILG
jgi:hypothetical protein